MFSYCYIDKYGIKTPADIAFEKDLAYLESKIANGTFKKLVILKKFF